MTVTEFDLRLAALLGAGCATRMKHTMPHREYVAWRLMDRRWPIGWARDDLARARQTCVTANAFGGESTPADYLPPELISREMDDEQLRAAGEAMATNG